MGRPRKYANAAEKQAAYRNRWVVKSIRFEQKTAESIEKLAETLDTTETEVVNSLVKFGLTNHRSETLGLWGKRLPAYVKEKVKENPMSNATDRAANMRWLRNSYIRHIKIAKKENDIEQIAIWEERLDRVANALGWSSDDARDYAEGGPIPDKLGKMIIGTNGVVYQNPKLRKLKTIHPTLKQKHKPFLENKIEYSVLVMNKKEYELKAKFTKKDDAIKYAIWHSKEYPKDAVMVSDDQNH